MRLSKRKVPRQKSRQYTRKTHVRNEKELHRKYLSKKETTTNSKKEINKFS